MFSTLRSVLWAVVCAWVLVGCEAGPPPTNLTPAKEKSAQCVEPTDDMRKNHMAYLNKHRDATVIEGIRTTQHSLNECINCHVAPTRSDNSPVHYGDKDHFCTNCHVYAGVKIDCFQCHADRPEVAKQTNYQHRLGSSQGYHHSSQQLSTAQPLSTQDVQAITNGGVQ